MHMYENNGIFRQFPGQIPRRGRGRPHINNILLPPSLRALFLKLAQVITIFRLMNIAGNVTSLYPIEGVTPRQFYFNSYLECLPYFGYKIPRIRFMASTFLPAR